MVISTNDVKFLHLGIANTFSAILATILMSFVVVRGQLAPRYRDEKISDYQRQWRISVKSCLERKSVARSCFFFGASTLAFAALAASYYGDSDYNPRIISILPQSDQALRAWSDCGKFWLPDENRTASRI